MKKLIIKILKSGKPIKRRELLEIIRKKWYWISDRAMRNAIVELIEEGVYIQSTSKGYKLCKKPEDFVTSIKYLRKKALSIFNRMAKLEKGLRELNQLRLPYSNEKARQN